MLKSIATGSNKPSQAQKQTSPYARKLDGVIALKVDKFETIDGQVFAIGTNLETGEEMRITREWSNHPRNQNRENPMKSASERLASGAVIMFTGVDAFKSSSIDGAYHAAGFETVTTFDDPDAVVALEGKRSVFVDQIDSTSNGEQFQMYNVIQGDDSIRVKTPEELVRAFADHISEADAHNDGILLRIYSPEEGISSVIRFILSPDESIEETLKRFTESDAHYIEMVGAQEGVMEVSGPMLMSMLADNDMDAIWEVIPVTGYRHGISHPNANIAASLKKKAQEVFSEAVVDANGALHGFRTATFAYQEKTYRNGMVYSSVRAFHHEPGMPQALSLVPTGHVDDLVLKFGQGLTRDETTVSKVDVSSLIKQLAAEVESKRIPVKDPIPEEVEVDEIDFMSDEVEQNEVPVGDLEEVDFMSDEVPEKAASNEEIDDFLSDNYVSTTKVEEKAVAKDFPEPEVALSSTSPEPEEAEAEVEAEETDWNFEDNDILEVGSEEGASTEPLQDELPIESLEEVQSTDEADVNSWFDESDSFDLSVSEQDDQITADSVDEDTIEDDLMSAFSDAVYDLDAFDEDVNQPAATDDVPETVEATETSVNDVSVASNPAVPEVTTVVPKPRKDVEQKPARVRLNERESAAQPTTIDRPMPLKGQSKKRENEMASSSGFEEQQIEKVGKPSNPLMNFKPDPADEVSLATGITGIREYSVNEIMKTQVSRPNLASSDPHVNDNDPLSDEALASAFGL